MAASGQETIGGPRGGRGACAAGRRVAGTISARRAGAAPNPAAGRAASGRPIGEACLPQAVRQPVQSCTGPCPGPSRSIGWPARSSATCLTPSTVQSSTRTVPAAADRAATLGAPVPRATGRIGPAASALCRQHGHRPRGGIARGRWVVLSSRSQLGRESPPLSSRWQPVAAGRAIAWVDAAGHPDLAASAIQQGDEHGGRSGHARRASRHGGAQGDRDPPAPGRGQIAAGGPAPAGGGVGALPAGGAFGHLGGCGGEGALPDLAVCGHVGRARSAAAQDHRRRARPDFARLSGRPEEPGAND